MKVLAIIPARYGSTRFPGKPLVDIAGQTLIQRVYQQCLKATGVHKTIVATDDTRIMEHVLSFGGDAVMTATTHPTGTDRCVEAYQKLGERYDIILNIQGDEPFVAPEQINTLAHIFELNPQAQIGTLAKLITDPDEITDPKEAKVVFNAQNQVLYMSRSPIPYFKDLEISQWNTHHDYFKHIGIYGFRESTLLEISSMKQTKLEKVESLEQLRWLDKYSMYLGFTDIDTLSIDRPEDLKEVYKYV
ncbi:MAG TPA: 3-deoxy-manno-octulosonate cytidylyltransferase [Cytophagales bacterium]|nr:3-deoxy-manno-octulosonate cytidylyltransferase [Cytophagales bacterium]